MPANPNVPHVAAQQVANALSRCHPGQRAEMLHAIIAQCEVGLAVYRGSPFCFVPDQAFMSAQAHKVA